MTKLRFVIILFALIGAVLGAIFGALAAPTAERYKATAYIALIPGPDLTTVESSSFWEVLTRGQITRTAAIVYDDTRWLPSAAKAANVRQSELTIAASALPNTSVFSVTVKANSSAAAEAALSDVLIKAAPQVASVTQPFVAKLLAPTEGTAYPVPLPPRTQFAAAGGLAGLLVGGGIGWYFLRRRLGPQVADGHASDRSHTEDVGVENDDDAVVEDHARHRGW